MKSFLTSFSLALTIFTNVFSQTPNGFNLTKGIGGKGTDIGYSVTTDKDSNIIITGQFKDTVNFGATTLISYGLADVFIAKYDAKGNFIWAKQIGGITNDVGKDITTDQSNNIYVTGYFVGSLTIDGTISLVSKGYEDIFLAKYNPSGIIQWANEMGGPDADFGESIAFCPTGEVVLTGIIRNSASFSTTTLVSAGGEDVFIAKYKSNGVLKWAKRAGGTVGDVGHGIACDLIGNIFITGFLAGTAKFDAITMVSSGQQDVFLAKYDSTGNALWVKKGISQSNAYEQGFGVSTDRFGNVYIDGYFYGGTSLTFGSTALSNSGQWDMFVVKYNTLGAVKWAKKFGSSLYDYAYDIATDYNGNIVMTGGFGGTVDFGVTSLTSTNSSVEDLFVLKLDSNGTGKWVTQAGSSFSSLNYVWGEGLTVDYKGNVIVTGSFEGKPNFGTTQLIGQGKDEAYGEDIFITKINQNIPWVESISISAIITDVSCNGGSDGAISISASNGTTPYTYSWTTGQTTLSISGLQSGSYTVTVTDALGKSNTSSISLNQPQPLNLSMIVSNLKCFGAANGSTILNISGGTIPYTYSWTNGAVTKDISSLVPNTYSVTVTDANNCTNTAGAIVSSPSVLTISHLVTKSSSQSTCDGSIDLTVSGGTFPYTYLWGDGKITQDVNGLCTGNHSITVTDANSCTTNQLIFVDFITLLKEIEGYVIPAITIKSFDDGIAIWFLQNNNQKSLKVNMTNTLGQTVYTTSINTQISNSPLFIPLNSVPKGIYFIQLSNDKAAKGYKIIHK